MVHAGEGGGRKRSWGSGRGGGGTPSLPMLRINCESGTDRSPSLGYRHIGRPETQRSKEVSRVTVLRLAWPTPGPGSSRLRRLRTPNQGRLQLKKDRLKSLGTNRRERSFFSFIS